MPTRRLRETIPPRKRIGLVLSGGGVKAAAFHLGVCLALKEKGFKFQSGLVTQDIQGDSAGQQDANQLIRTYVGSSAGSVVATMLASGHSLESIFAAYLEQSASTFAAARPLDKITYRQLLSRKRPAILNEAEDDLVGFSKLTSAAMNLLKSDGLEGFLRATVKINGFFTTAGIEEYIREQVVESNDFNNLVPNLYVTATQLNHGRKIVFGKNIRDALDESNRYFSQVPISQAVAASTAVPVLYTPYPIYNATRDKIHFYTDGEVRDTLSTHVAVDDGCDLVIASYTHQPYRYDELHGSLTKAGLPALIVQTIYQVLEKKIENFKEKQRSQVAAYDKIREILRHHGVSSTVETQVLDTLEETLKFNRDVRYIYIHPSYSDSGVFFTEHFSLHVDKMTHLVKQGFRSAINCLRHFHFS